MTTTHDTQPDTAGPEHRGGAESKVNPDAQLHGLLQRNATTHEVADLLGHFPMQRMALIQELHRTRGNAFVQAVLTEVEPQKGPALEPSHDKPGLSPGSVFAIPQPGSNDAVIANLRRYADVGDQHMSSFTPVLLGYGKARDALDKGGVHQLGTTALGSLEVMRAAVDGMDDQLKRFKPGTGGAPGKDPKATTEQGAPDEEIELLRQRRDVMNGVMVQLQIAALTTMAPLQFRGNPIPDVQSPVARIDNKHGVDVREQASDELVRSLTVINASERLALQFVKPGALHDKSLLLQARQDIREFAHRPLDLAFLRAVLSSSGLWQALNTDEGQMNLAPGMSAPKPKPWDMAVCKDDGPLTSLYADTKKQAERTGWGNDIGRWDPDYADMEIQMADSDGIISVYSRIMSAQPDGRAAILNELKRRNRLEPFLESLPWAYTKDMHDGLPGGHGEIKSALQKHFLVEGKWGTSLELKEEHATSVTGMLKGAAEDVGGIGGDIIDGFDTALNFLTLGFTHGYGNAQDAHNAGMITDDQFQTQLRQITIRTTVGMAIMMATAGYGRAAMGAQAAGTGAPVMMGVGGGRTVAQTALATGVEGATFATTEMFALDTTDIATGAKSQYSSTTDYLKAALLGGGFGAAIGGTTSYLTSRTMSRYMAGTAMTRGQSLAAGNPNLAPMLDAIQGVEQGATVSMRVTAVQADALAEAGLINKATHKALRVALAEHGEIEATFQVTADLKSPIPEGAKAPTGEAFELRSAPTPAKGPNGVPVPRTTLGSSLPEGAVVERVSATDEWTVYKTAGGDKRIRFRSAQAKVLNEAREGRNLTGESKAGVNDEGHPFVMEGKHRAIGNSQGDQVKPDAGGVQAQPGVLDYPFYDGPIDDVGIWAKDQKIDYSQPEVPIDKLDAARTARGQ